MQEQKKLTSIVVVHTNFGEHGVILNLRLPQRWAVVRYQNQLSCTFNRASNKDNDLCNN